MNALQTSLLLLTSTALGQSVQPLPLHDAQHYTSDTLICKGLSTAVLERGSFLIQLSGGAQPSDVVQRISLDASHASTFDVKSVLRPEALADRTPYVWAFASSSTGEVYILTRWLKDRVPDINDIAVFDSSGTFERFIPTALGNVQVLHMAVFRDGSFAFIAGTMGVGTANSVSLVIVDDTGRTILERALRKLSSSEEETARTQAIQQARAHQANKQSTQENTKTTVPEAPDQKHPGDEMNTLFFHTHLVSSDDGTVYLLRPDKGETVYRLRSDGEITPIPLKVPLIRDASLSSGPTELTNATVSGTELILFYSVREAPPTQFKSTRLTHLLIRSYSLFNGEPTGSYAGDPQQLGTSPLGWDGRDPYYAKSLKDAQPSRFEIVRSSR